MDLETAVRAYTMGGAFACFAEDRRGSITVGKQADLVLLSEDLFALEAEPRRILDVHVDSDGRRRRGRPPGVSAR